MMRENDTIKAREREEIGRERESSLRIHHYLCFGIILCCGGTGASYGVLGEIPACYL
jgi:hypothetical protein